MPPEPRGEEDVRKIIEALRKKIREHRLTYEEVEQRAGMGREYLRQVLRGHLKLRVQHVVAILEALNVPPIEFWVEVYGPPPSAMFAGEPDHDRTFRTTVRVIHRSLLRQMIWKLKEKGVFTPEETERMFEELEQTMRLTEPPL